MIYIYTYICHFVTHFIHLLGLSMGKWVWSCQRCHVFFYFFIKIIFKITVSTSSCCKVSSNTNVVKIDLILAAQSDSLLLTLDQAPWIRRVTWAASWGRGWTVVRCFVAPGVPWNQFADVSSFRNDHRWYEKLIISWG